MATLNPHQREALDRFRESPIVERVSYTFYKVSVWFKDGLRENYRLNAKHAMVRKSRYFPRTNLFLNDIPTFSEYESRPFEDEYNELIKPHFCVQYSDFEKAGFVDIRLKIHEIVMRLMNEEWPSPKLPKEVLLSDWAAVKSDARKFIKQDKIYQRSSSPIGLKLLLHFADSAFFPAKNKLSLKDASRDPKLLVKTIEYLLRKGHDITRIAILVKLCQKVSTANRLGIIQPSHLRCILRDILKCEKPKVLNLNPDYGSALLAVGAEGGKYREINIKPWLLNLSSFINTEASEYKGEPVDVAYYGTLPCSIDDLNGIIAKYRPLSKYLVIPVLGADIDRAKSIAPPSRIYKINLKSIGLNDFLLVYNSTTI